jgi:2-polyprenyl-3-methyl-5-hydroxy-6-metoxy-1,4-benzoquinol methylase
MTLETQRRLAAEASRGISSGPSYDLARRLLAARGNPGRILEFGAGTGNFARRLIAEQVVSEMTCADILPRPDDLPRGIEWIHADLNDPLASPDAAFDTIVCIEVIEHLENPRAAFREFHRLLRTGGNLILTTPNQESVRSLASLVLGRHFAAFLGASYPAHITALLEMDFQRICAETGFESPRFDYSNTGRIPKLTRFRWPQVFRGRWFSDNLGLIACKRAH